MSPQRPGAPPRLLLLTADYPPAHGGVQTLVHKLAHVLPAFEVEVLALDAPGAAGFDRCCPLPTRRVSVPPHAGRLRMALLNAAAVRRGLRLRPHVTLSAHLVVSPAAAALRALTGSRTAQYFYGNEVCGKPRLAAFAAARAELVLAISGYTASLVLGTGARPARLRVVPPGVDPPGGFHPPPPGPPTVLTIAQLKHSYKGHDVLARAIAEVRERVPDVEWVVIGEGPLRGRAEALARAQGLDGHARFLGAVTDGEREAWLARASVLALPSRTPPEGLAGEGFGIVYLEAGAHARPVLAGRAAGAPEAVVDGVNGLLVDPTDAHAVARALTRMLLDRELAARLGRGGLDRAREHAWPAIGERVQGELLALAGVAA